MGEDRQYIVEYPAIIRVPISAFNRDEALGGAPGYLPACWEGEAATVETEQGSRIVVLVPSHSEGVRVFRVDENGEREVTDVGS